MNTNPADAAFGAGQAPPARRQETLTQRVAGFFLRDRRAMVGMILLVVMLFAAFAGPRLVPYEPDQPNVRNRFAAPSWSHWMGTDRSGRDMLSRVLAGASISFRVAIGAALLALLIGAPLGAVTSYIGGLVDDVTQRCMDAIIAFPARLLAIVLVVLMGPSVVSLWFAIAFSSIPRYARIVRSGVLTHKEREYVEAARAMGQRPMGVLMKQILPNIMAPVAVQITLDFARAIGVEAALSYLGLGLSAPYISWGLMVREAQDFLEVAPWLAVFPGLALAGVILGFTLVGDSLRDRMDPRTRLALNRRGQ